MLLIDPFSVPFPRPVKERLQATLNILRFPIQVGIEPGQHMIKHPSRYRAENSAKAGIPGIDVATVKNHFGFGISGNQFRGEECTWLVGDSLAMAE